MLDTSPAAISGETLTWHKVTLDFTGPDLSETEETFTDYRMTVTFRNDATGETIEVPGYFAADGDAANTSASSGNVWRAHFNPPSEGTWSYEASFRTGDNVAVSLAENPGSSAGFFDGAGGTLEVGATDKTGDDLRAKGMLSYDGDQYLNFEGDGSVFLKSGVGSPENFLAYSGFDNTPDKNTTHDYDPHVQHFNDGDPTWGDGEGEGIIGAVNYLAEQGVNSLYMMMMNIGGDGREVSPWTSSDVFNIKKDAGTNDNSYNITIDARSFDVSKLDQWEILFEHMQKMGITLHLFFQETENDYLLNDGDLGLEKQLLIREMVARFGHHNGIIWNLGEETTNTAGQLRDHSEYLKAVDPYDHPVALHTYPNQHDKYEDFEGEPTLDALSFQTSGDTQVPDLDRYLGGAESAGRPVVAFLDEPGNATIGMAAEGDPGWQQNHENLRETLWRFYTEGGSGAEWYFGYQTDNGQGGDLLAEDFSTRESAYQWAEAAREFFERLPLEQMSDGDALTTNTNGSDHVLADVGNVYAIYLPNGGSATLDLSGVSGDFSVRWYDVIEGTYHNGTVQSVSGGSKVNLGQAPNDRNDDWAILVEADGTAPPPTDPPSPPAGDPIYQMEDGLVIMQAESGVFLFEDNDANETWKLITDQNGYKGDGYLLFDTGTDYFDGKWAGTPVTAPMKYTFRIDGEDAAGTYYINIRSTKPNTGETSDRNNDFFVASGPAGEEPSDWKKVFFGGGPNKWLWGQTYDVNHVHTDATFEVDGPGDYTIYVSGRSRQAAFDEIHISKDGFHYDVSKPTSPTVGGTTPPADDPPADDPPADDPPADDPPIDPPTDVDFELSLIDIATGLVVEELENGEEVAYAQVEGKELTLVATPVDENGDPVPVGSVRFDAGSLGTRVESVAPFALYGDTDSAYLGGTVMGTGSYTVTMQAFAGESASGSSLGATTIAFSVSEAEVEDRPPEATDVTYDAAEDSGAKTFEASAFATDPDGDAVFIRSVAGATLGTVSVASGGTALTYTPTANANGTDTVTVRMWDGSDPGTTVNATLTVDLSAVNDTPEAVDDAITVTSGETTWIASRLLGNDTDVEGDDLTIAVLSEIGEGLTLDLRPNGGMNITAERGTGTATFQYTVSDGQTTSVPATVTVTVEDAPIPDPDPDPDPEPPVDDEPGTVIAAINIGGGAYEGSDGTRWAADTTGEGNVYVRTDAVDILGTDDDPLYHSEAWGRRGLDYDFDVSDGTYKVELHFAEIWSKAKTAGKRVFDVEIEGATVVDNLDLAGDHGYETVYVMTTEVTVTDGNLDIDLKKGVQNPKLSAIKITALDDAPSEPGPDPISEYLQFSIGDSVTDGFLESIDYSGQTFDLEDGASPVVFANAHDGVTEVESVALTIGGKRQVESFEPYSLFSDIKGDFRDDGFLSEGDHTVKIEVYSGNRGTGELLETVEFDLALI